jgi:KUP system potassium uptake protein
VVAGALGIVGIARTPAVLAALSPLPAITYLWHAGPLAFVVIGGAFLAVTGGEAFYADMGHFGPFPIRIAWFGVALPALTLNYFGQGGLLLTEPGAIDSPFYELAPQWLHYPLVILATIATVIASQSIISGAYSMSQQAIRLGFLPRMKIVHTAGHEIGQVYVPFVNWALAVATLAAVIGVGRAGWRLWHSRFVTDGDHDVDGDVRRTALEAQSHPRLCSERQPARARPTLFRLNVDETL